MQKVTEWILPFIFIAGLAAILLANPDPLARNSLCASAGVCFHSANPQFWNNLLYELGLGSVVSVAFYWLLVLLPERTRRLRLKHHLLNSYKHFRRRVVWQLIFASGISSVDLVLAEALVTQKQFREYFKQPSERVDGDRWHDVANNIDDSHVAELLILLETMRSDILYVLNNTDISDQKTFDLLQNISKSLFWHHNQSIDYDGRGRLLGFFWEIMAGWDPLIGYTDGDPVQHIIDRI